MEVEMCNGCGRPTVPVEAAVARARREARAAAGSRRPSLDAWAPLVGPLVEAYGAEDVNAALGWEPTRRYLRRVVAAYRDAVASV